MKTKELLAESFRELALSMPFQKISIKMITDKAGVIRPTFYNYFQDKYEVIEFLYEKDIQNNIQVMLDNDMDTEAIKLMFICFEKNRKYYKTMLAVIGQNSFEEFFDHRLEDTFLFILKKHPMRQLPSSLITPEMLAHFNAMILIEMVKLWLSDSTEVSAEEMYEAYCFFLKTSVLDMIQYPPVP